ncbi:MAG: hypothetical protein Q8Q09_12595 [Deltaproteobacteria bacterium]|nr:hypothetical protein [Deltaproteobacteria bacterium]
MATNHTYYLVAKHRMAGKFAGDTELASALRGLYERLLQETEATSVDGCSVWRDDADTVQIRAIVGGVSQTIDSDNVRAAFAGAESSSQ